MLLPIVPRSKTEGQNKTPIMTFIVVNPDMIGLNVVAKLEGFDGNWGAPCTKTQQSTAKVPPITPLSAVASYN
jgi:hypothetical protein